MRAIFINEKFTEDSDPISDMNIGYPARQINTMSWKILKFIESKGEEGAGLTEIQYYIWTELEGHDKKSFWEKGPSRPRGHGDQSPLRRTRGHWTTNLFGGPNYHEGLLNKYCVKNPKNKKWVLKRLPRPNEKFYS